MATSKYEHLMNQLFNEVFLAQYKMPEVVYYHEGRNQLIVRPWDVYELFCKTTYDGYIYVGVL